MNVLYLSILPILCRFASSSEWCYQSQVHCNKSQETCEGPEEWEKVAATCGGERQSPINIVTNKVQVERHLTPMEFEGYKEKFTSDITNNGHTVQIILPINATISEAGLEDTYKVQQLHLHWGKNGEPGSEHTIDGERYPMELHIVHIKQKYTTVQQALSDPTGVAVLGFFYEESKQANKKYDIIIKSLKNITRPDTNVRIGGFSLESLILSHEKLEKYFRYNGSLTTPNCSEAVVWTVFEEAIPLSKEQLSAFSNLTFSDGTAMVNTFRPVQPRHEREVFYSSSYVFCVGTAFLVSSVFTSLCVFTG